MAEKFIRKEKLECLIYGQYYGRHKYQMEKVVTVDDLIPMSISVEEAQEKADKAHRAGVKEGFKLAIERSNKAMNQMLKDLFSEDLAPDSEK